MIKSAATVITSPNTEWTEWLKTVASFVVGVAVSYLTILFQNRFSDRHEQQKMRRVIYRELAESILWTNSMAENLPPIRYAKVTEPPGAKVVNSPYTFEGEEYMRQNHEVSYSLPEMVQVKRMYVLFQRMSKVGQTVYVGEFKLLLVYFGKEFKKERIIRNSFKKFARADFRSLRAIANYYADYKVKPEEIARIIHHDRDERTKET